MKHIPSKVGVESQQMPLRETLRAGDPAREAEPLEQEEIQAMRRAMLGAVVERAERKREAPWRLPLLAATALAALAALVLGLHAWLAPARLQLEDSAPRLAATQATQRLPSSERSPLLASGSTDLAPRVSSSPSGASAPDAARAPGAPPGSKAASRRAIAASASSHRRASREATARRSRPASIRPTDGGARLASTAVPATSPNATAIPAVRELQFSTPGGTRIVWVFASGDAHASEAPRPSRL